MDQGDPGEADGGDRACGPVPRHVVEIASCQWSFAFHERHCADRSGKPGAAACKALAKECRPQSSPCPGSLSSSPVVVVDVAGGASRSPADPGSELSPMCWPTIWLVV